MESVWKEPAVAGICLEELSKTMKHLSQHGQCPARDSNRERFEYTSEALTLEPNENI
jgi:hypothetical protein